MNEQMEKLIVALMVLIDENGGRYTIDSGTYEKMYEARHSKGIQVQEAGDQGVTLILGDMSVSPDEAMNN